MNKEYYLIKKITTTGHKNPIQVVDKVIAQNKKEAIKEFIRRNKIPKILKKANLIVCLAIEWWN